MSILDFEGYEAEGVAEIERDQAIDPIWEKQQKTTFAAWCNSHLRKANTSIDKIEEDFRNGLKLMTLLEVISGECLPKPDRGKMRVHRIANVNKALDFIQQKGVKLVSIGAEEIVDGNVKMTLGMIWTIILRFTIQDIQIEDMSAKEGLLLWCQRKTAPYKNVNVSNFHTSFKDGLALCALIHRHRPELIDYDKLSREHPRHNLNMAFDVADKHLDIPPMLDVDDMLNSVKPDERSVMAYVSTYYHTFSGAQKAETASSRICKVLGVNKMNEQLMKDYDSLSSNLLSWIEETIQNLQKREPCGSATEHNEKLMDFSNYQRNIKPPKLEEKGKLETTFTTLQTRLMLSNRPAFLPEEGKLVSDINDRWRELERVEKERERWLVAELRRLEQLDHLVKKFYLKCSTHESWTSGKEDMLRSTDYLQQKTVGDVRALQKRHEAFGFDLRAHQPRVKRIAAIATDLESLGYHDMPTILDKLESIEKTWILLGNLSTTREASIKKALEKMETIDALQLDFVKRSAPIFNWIEQAKEELQDTFMLHSVDEVKDLIKCYNEFISTLSNAENELIQLREIPKKIALIAKENDLGVHNVNPYSVLTMEDIERDWQEVMTLTPKRDEMLQKELEQQNSNERLRKEFATQANKIAPWIMRKQEMVSQIAMGYLVYENGVANGTEKQSHTLEEQLAALHALEKEVLEKKSELDELDKCNMAMEQCRIFENQHTSHNMQTLRINWEQLIDSIRRATNEVDNQVLTRDSKGITQEQMEEFRKSFNYFDKSRNGKLEHKEFKACLMSLGYNIRDDKQGEMEFSRIINVVDPNDRGYVTFEAFLDFMTKESAEEDSSDNMIQSFRVLAGDKPYITAEEIRRELPPAEAEYCLQHMQPYKGANAEPGALDYTAFCCCVYGQSDL